MTRRYSQTFQKLQTEKKIAFAPFWMLGDPDETASLEIIKTIGEKADILELGIPFSDPLADGETIQASVKRALNSGVTPLKALELVKKIRKIFPEKPIGLLVYFNLVLRVGLEKFFHQCQQSGVDSLLIPELPIEELETSLDDQKKPIQYLAQKYDIDLIFLVSTNTPKDRLEKILKSAGGFLYCISTPSITGAKNDISPDTIDMIKRLKQQTEIPLMIGFGIASPEHIQILKKSGADGAIIGSKLFTFREDLPALKKFLESCQKVQ
jgi:tryptophan synthase alpha chain